MAQVWRGIHTHQKVPVAIKILHGANKEEVDFFRSFREEVRAVAGLEHPSIVRVLDYGVLDAAFDAPHGENYEKGVPWLAMELAHNSLLPYCGRLAWRYVYPIATNLLRALAHAHARGVIHRDIKPENILTFEHLHDIKLTDFGIAHSNSTSLEEGSSVAWHGTPPYMAPEQLSGDWRSFGPWTDLYALGGTLFALLTGQPPLGSHVNLMEAMGRHLMDEPIHFPEELEVPPGLESWMQKMMAKMPVDRFSRAADALHALEQLQAAFAPELLEQTLTLPGLSQAQLQSPELASDETLFEPQRAPTKEHGSLQFAELMAWKAAHTNHSSSDPAGAKGGFRFDPVQLVPRLATILKDNLPFPEQPSEDSAGTADHSLQEVGLGLVGIRAVPMMGREREKEELWQTLRKVAERQELRWIQITGEEGIGKNRLARWLCESAHEEGVATTLKARHHSTTPPLYGLQSMLAQHLQLTDLSREALVDRLQLLFLATNLSQEERWLSLAEVLHPLPKPGSTQETDLRRVYFSTPSERYEAILLFLQLLAEERALVLWLDEPEWSLDSLQFLEHCLKSNRSNSIPLMLLTTHREGLKEERTAGQYLHELTEQYNPTTLPLQHLSYQNQRAMLKSLLPLEEGLLAALLERSAGNPSFSQQWLKDWVANGSLRPTEKGFVLKAGIDRPSPENLKELWKQRLQKLLDKESQETLVALELAAFLGNQVVQTEWERACALSWLTVPTDFLEKLLSQNLVYYDQKNSFETWSFAHESLREGLVASARVNGRWEQHHSICADLLRASQGRNEPFQQARHLRDALRPLEALVPMRVAIQQRVDEGHLRMALSLLEEWEDLLMVLFPDRNNKEWAEASYYRVLLFRRHNRYQEAEELLGICEPLARRNQWEELLVRLLCERAMLNWIHGHSDLTSKALFEAEERALNLGNIALQAEVSMTTSELLTRVGKLEEAESSAQLSRNCYQLAGDPLGEGKSFFLLAFVARQRGEWEKVSHYLPQAQALFESTGAQRNLANCLNFHGDFARKRGSLEEAEQLYREALAKMEMLDIQTSHLIVLNLAITLVRQCSYEESIMLVQETLDKLRGMGAPVLTAAAWLIQLPGYAALKQWDKWDRNVAKVLPFFTRTHDVDVDFAEVAELAGDLAAADAEYDRSMPLYQLAMNQWIELKQEKNAALVEKKMDAIAQDAFATLTVPGSP